MKVCYEINLCAEDTKCPDFIEVIRRGNCKKYTDCWYRNKYNDCTATYIMTTSTNNLNIKKIERKEK
jgi:hypothetical protein